MKLVFCCSSNFVLGWLNQPLINRLCVWRKMYFKIINHRSADISFSWLDQHHSNPLNKMYKFVHVGLCLKCIWLVTAKNKTSSSSFHFSSVESWAFFKRHSFFLTTFLLQVNKFVCYLHVEKLQPTSEVCLWSDIGLILAIWTWMTNVFRMILCFLFLFLIDTIQYFINLSAVGLFRD